MNIDCNNTTVIVEEKVINVNVTGGRGPQGDPGLDGLGLYTGNSSDFYDSLPIGFVTLNVEPGLSFTPTNRVTIWPSNAPPINYSFGYVDSYDSETGELVIYVEYTSGNPSSNAWVITLSGPQGPEGPSGPIGQKGDSTWGSITGTLSTQTDLQNALNTKVPYTGATQDVNLGEFGLLTGNIEFDLTPTNVPTAVGSMYYIDSDGTLGLVLKGGNVISRVGETQHVRVYNNTGSPIAKGKVVAIAGSQGQRPTIILADADSEALSKDTIGFTAEAIANGAQGFVMIAGMLTNVSTSGMTDGATVYLSTTAGDYTTTKPADPAHLVILGFVVNGGSGGAGSIYVKVDNGYEIEELHNVSISNIADEDLLSYETSSQLWKNKPRRYQQTFTSGTSFNVTFATIKFQPNSIRVFKPTGEEVSIVSTISDKVYIQSNVNLLDHILKIT